MSKILIESKPVGVSLNFFDHLYIVYEDDTGSEFVIRGGPRFGVPPFGRIVIEPGVPIADSEDNRSDPQTRHSIELNLNGRNAHDVWDVMTQQSISIAAANVDYDINFLSESQNSNSVFSSVLNAVGINPLSHLPMGITSGDVPGLENFIDIDTALFGTSSLDWLVGGDGDDSLTGGDGSDYLYGDQIFILEDPAASHNDTLIGEAGDDILAGDIGDDELNGGTGYDTYEIGVSGDGSDSIVDSDGKGLVAIKNGGASLFFISGNATAAQSGSSGKQLYELVEHGVKLEYNPTVKDLVIYDWNGHSGSDKITIQDFDNGDLGINLPQKQDLVFSIDLSGSMGDDIAAVKAKVVDVLNALFKNTDNRVGIITFNDVGSIHTVLNLTNDKAAAQSGINSLAILGGGAEPLNGSLLHALNGGAGQWRAEADVSRRIVVFSDEPPADPQLADVVRSASVNVAAVVQPGAAPLVTHRLAFQNAIAAEGDVVTVPVDIFTVAIGNDPAAIRALAEIATNNRGQAFTAATANDLVDALLQAIAAPPVDTNLAPEISGFDATPEFTIFGAPVAVDAEIALSDDGGTLQSATVRLIGKVDTAEILMVDALSAGLTANYDTVKGTLTVTGTASISDYEAVLETLIYDNLTAGIPTHGVRTVEVVVNDG